MQIMKWLMLVTTILLVSILVVPPITSAKTLPNTGVQPPIDLSEWNTRTKVWLARSCVGEARFARVTKKGVFHDECIAIAYVYATRVKITQFPLIKIIRKYSSAIKRHAAHQRPWIMELNKAGRRPASFPRNLSWKPYKLLWEDKLEILDSWAKGYIPNPVPGANHYGSDADAYRAERIYRWKRLKAPKHFKNRFYTSFEKTPRRLFRSKQRLSRILVPITFLGYSFL